MPEIVSRCKIKASSQAVFDACRSVDLHLALAEGISARAVGGRVSGLSGLGDATTWSAKFFGLRFRLTTEMTHFLEPSELDDTLVRGLFRSFGHRYRIREIDGEPGWVELSDHFRFECPFGKVGELGAKVFIQPAMERAQAIRIAGIKAATED